MLRSSAIPLLSVLCFGEVAAGQAPAIMAELGCVNCHSDLGVQSRVREVAPDLSAVAPQRTSGWLLGYLQEPTIIRTNLGRTRMPDFHLKEPEALALALYLKTLTNSSLENKSEGPALNLTADSLAQMEHRFREAQQANPAVNAALGERIFISQNCAACHPHKSIAPRTNAAPHLLAEGARVQKAWLLSFLKGPTPIRPFGFVPGDGSRMPDFRLTEGESAEIAQFLTSPASPSTAAPTSRVSRFSMEKARSLLTQKFSCIGCHRIAETGGRIGPDLTKARQRLQPGYISQMISDPQTAAPHSIMPKIPLSKPELALITSFLLHMEQSPQKTEYLSLVENPVHIASPSSSPEQNLYQRLCASCHGATGFGNGYNARFLPHRPTLHADSNYMRLRPDDTLYDGIYSGGAILNRSHTMPPWGETLSRPQIGGLVRYIRELCRCDGPAWAAEGRK